MRMNRLSHLFLVLVFILFASCSKSGSLGKVKSKLSLAAGSTHSLALKNDGTVWAWGYNEYGELGLGDNTNRNIPTQIEPKNLNGITAIAAGEALTLALKNDGTVWAWGYNVFGQLGVGDKINRNTPTQIDPKILNGVTAIAAGMYHSLALKNDGTVWTWGLNSNGQLGLGDNTDKNIPIRISRLTGVTAITAGDALTLALKNDGTVWAWGNNSNGRLGLGDNTNRNIPTQIDPKNLNGITAIAASFVGQTLALKNDGTVWTWGWNGNGQLGLGDNIARNTPTKISNFSGVTTIAVGGAYSLVFKNDDTVWAWGLSDATNKNTPIKISSLTGINAIAISTGGAYSLALKNDGTVWTWGYNEHGELGLGDTTDRKTPTRNHNF